MSKLINKGFGCSKITSDSPTCARSRRIVSLPVIQGKIPPLFESSLSTVSHSTLFNTLEYDQLSLS